MSLKTSEKSNDSSPKKKVNGRVKGASFERNVVKELERITGIKWDRTFRSGGGKAKGDVNPVNARNPFVIELKNRESWQVHQLLDTCKEVDSWWEKLCEEALESKLDPMLIFTKNRVPILVRVHHKVFTLDLFYYKKPSFFLRYKDSLIFRFDALQDSEFPSLYIGGTPPSPPPHPIPPFPSPSAPTCR